ncbi:MAG: RNA 2'-phosphotransferase [bacterium]|nr:RNA 2'-phosphotransferase [bacterium]
MDEKELVRISKFLSLVLRHKPGVINIELDENGWTSTADLIEKINKQKMPFDIEKLKVVVEKNSKKRFSFNEDLSKIRANQGHSLDVDLDLEPVVPPEILYHGTATRFAENIKIEGLKKKSRHHVHLSAVYETAVNVGSRHGKVIVLKIKSGDMHKQGDAFYLSKNGVWLTDEVAPEFIIFE